MNIEELNAMSRTVRDDIVTMVNCAGSGHPGDSLSATDLMVGLYFGEVINLDNDSAPDIYNAIHRNALLENVTVDAYGKIDFNDESVTENTRVFYPIEHIEKIAKNVNGVSAGPAAEKVIFLSADAFGVLPSVSILTPEQTQYYFLSGFTAKLSGTDSGTLVPGHLRRSQRVGRQGKRSGRTVHQELREIRGQGLGGRRTQAVTT